MSDDNQLEQRRMAIMTKMAFFLMEYKQINKHLSWLSKSKNEETEKQIQNILDEYRQYIKDLKKKK